MEGRVPSNAAPAGRQANQEQSGKGERTFPVSSDQNKRKLKKKKKKFIFSLRFCI